MNTKEKLHQLRLNEWAARFSDQKASGLTVRQALPDIVPLAIPESVTIPESAVPIVPMPPENSTLTNCAIRTIRATATLTINGITIEVDSNITQSCLFPIHSSSFAAYLLPR